MIHNDRKQGESSIVLGIDPGTIVTGYACIEQQGKNLKAIDLGIIRPPKSSLLSCRYHTIYTSIIELMKKFKPQEIAIETPFVQKNAQSALKLGGALGCVMIAAQECAIPIYGYSPREVKQGVIGSGSATKEMLQQYLCHILRLEKSAMTYLDATDAVAIAIHHLELGRNASTFSLALEKRESKKI